MNQPWLIFDANGFCHRSLHSLHEGYVDADMVKIVYDFLANIQTLSRRFMTGKLVFCWDVGISKRCEIYPAYKANRTPQPDEFYRQMELLRTDYIPSLGYVNNFWAEGFEADDIIANLCLHSIGDSPAIIATSDHDLYQLLTDKVSVWHPRKDERVTKATFCERYGVWPSQWAWVKAMMGCSTDNIDGIDGIGIMRATQAINGLLKKDSVAYKAAKEGESIARANLRLTKLPYPGTPVFELGDNQDSYTTWSELSKKRLNINLKGFE